MADAPARVLLRVVDTETSGLAATDEIVEVGFTDVVFEPATKVCTIHETHSLLFKPTGPIPPEVMGVHHITPAMVADRPVFTREAGEQLVTGAGPHGLRPTFMVAHNAAFDRQWLTPELTGPAYWICTQKVARRQLPHAPNHKNQTLRYFLDLDVDPVRADPPHRAGADSYVTACLLVELIRRVDSISQMEAWTRAPLFYATCPLHKHKGKPWADVPADYLQWIMRAPDMDADLKAAAEDELRERDEANHAAMQARIAARAAQTTTENPS